MTNTKFRKRALLSSVAMLLVAIVALGSATFAWFNTQNSAVAHPVTAKTDKASDITLSETGTSGWTHNLTFVEHTMEDPTALAPITTDNTFATWTNYKAADNDTGYAAANATAESSFTKEEIESHPEFVKYTTLYVKSSTEQHVKVTPTVKTGGDAKIKNMLRVVFVPKAKATPVTLQATSKKVVWATALNDRSASVWEDDANKNTEKSTFSTTDDTVSNFAQVDLGKWTTADAICGYDVYVWVEGTDFDCKDSLAGYSVELQFDFVGADS